MPRETQMFPSATITANKLVKKNMLNRNKDISTRRLKQEIIYNKI